MTLLAAFADIGLALAAAGIYGVLAYSVAQRTREIGIRLALGAPRARILRDVLLGGVSLALLGIAIGVPAALALTRTLQTFFWGVSATDPVTFATVGVVLVTVSIAASLVPALRAIRLDPIAALRI
jgi:ABC-type antimicrobial peptide transport system permease subunit